MSSLERLIDRLQGVKASDEWDLADIFLAQCGDSSQPWFGHAEMKEKNLTM
jgi:hypothetical protein